MLKKIIGPLILGIAGCAVLISLSVWQVERLGWKENLIAETEASMVAPARMIDDVTLHYDEMLDGLRMIATGHFLEGFTDKLSGAGYHRLVPFKTSNHTIMVEIGFISEEKKHEAFQLPSGELSIEGNIYLPKGEGSLDVNRNIWVGYNIAKMAEQLNAEHIILVANESPVEGIESSPYTVDLPNNHLQYAITWGLLALAWGAMTVYWGYSRIRTRKTGK